MLKFFLKNNICKVSCGLGPSISLGFFVAQKERLHGASIAQKPFYVYLLIGSKVVFIANEFDKSHMALHFILHMRL